LFGRDTICTALHDNYDDEFDGRFVGNKRKRPYRTPLNALSSWNQEHSDGHEKLGEQALQIGKGIQPKPPCSLFFAATVHLPIYGSKDQYSAWLHSLILMPNVRKALDIAHCYVDLVESQGCECSTFISGSLLINPLSSYFHSADRRQWLRTSEVGEMLKIHERLR
ncbi:hypothetical protein GGX14DRAFT_671769, partial [Mycena pura]